MLFFLTSQIRPEQKHNWTSTIIEAFGLCRDEIVRVVGMSGMMKPIRFYRPPNRDWLIPCCNDGDDSDWERIALHPPNPSPNTHTNTRLTDYYTPVSQQGAIHRPFSRTPVFHFLFYFLAFFTRRNASGKWSHQQGVQLKVWRPTQPEPSRALSAFIAEKFTAHFGCIWSRLSHAAVLV